MYSLSGNDLPQAGRLHDRLSGMVARTLIRHRLWRRHGDLAHRYQAFRDGFLYGCNMSFRKRALEGLPDSDVFVGHGYGEDLYVSHWARRKGRIVVDPHLRVRHYQMPVSRDRMDQVSYRQIYNHFYLLQFMGASACRKVLFLYTAAGLVLISGARCAADYLSSGRSANIGRVTGGLRGVRDVLYELVGGRRTHRTA